MRYVQHETLFPQPISTNRLHSDSDFAAGFELQFADQRTQGLELFRHIILCAIAECSKCGT